MKVSVKLDSELNKSLSIVATLEGKKKEAFIEMLLRQSLTPYQEKINSYRFK